MKFIGEGAYRTVYQYDENTVIKINKHPKVVTDRYRPYCSNNNVNLDEWNNWLKVKDTKWQKYFCPCIEYRKDGTLLMIKAEEIPDDYDTKIVSNQTIVLTFPRFMSMEIKRKANCGLYKERIVCVDYQYDLRIK